MKKISDYLNEGKEKVIVVTFGRFQPPTIGHQKLIDKVKFIARSERAEYRIYPSRSYDKKKNPLSASYKIRLMKKMFKGTKIVDDSSIINPFYMMKQLSDEGYKKVILVVGGDRVKELDSQIRPYINHPDDKKAYYFDSFEVRSAGERDPDATGIVGMSASKMRAAATENDFDTFLLGIPNQDKKVATDLFNKLRKSMGIRESLNEEKKKKSPTVIVVTKSSQSNEMSDTVKRLEKVCKKKGISFYPVHTNHAFVVDKDMDDNKITIHNYNGTKKNINLTIDNTVCLVRGGALLDNAGLGMIKTFEEIGMFIVNSLDSMKFCENKMSTALALEQNKIPSPKTAFVNNEDSIDIALEKIGGKFPVIIKTITGAEGIGVSKIESYESLKSVLQSLWKHNAEIIIQEYMKITHDVRTLVLDGEIVACVKRIKGGKDFRTNKALGNDTAPYKPSKEEKDLVMKAYKMSGCYFAGVDHITNKGKHYILEVNGSPGSGAEPYMGYFPGKIHKDVSGEELINHVVDHIIDKDNWKFSAKEIGYVEWINVDGVGKVKAKIDTGNGSVNSIHADDVVVKGNDVSFKIMGKSYTKKIESKKRINIGSDELESRYVVLFDIIFGKKTFKNVPFTLSDRDRNTYLVLVGKRFLETTNYSVNVHKTFTLPEEHLNAADINFEFAVLWD